MVLDKLIT